MLHHKHSHIVLPVYIALCLTGILILFLSSRNQPKPQTNVTPTPASIDSTSAYRTTLEGNVVCLPHRDTSGPQTKECAIGILTDQNIYYALDASLMSAIPPEYGTGDRVKGNGLLTPIENLSSDHWQKYNVEGIFSATDSLEVTK